jgi:hypothetical protein
MAILGARPKFQAFQPGTTSPLAAGKLFTYVAGTTTKKNTYTTASEASTNTNPIILDSNGECNLWYGTGSYKLVLAPADDTDPPTNAIWTVDNFTASSDALADIVTGTSVGGFVNYINISNAASGSAPRITATGDGTDTNISLELETTGTGSVDVLAPLNVTGNTAVTGSLSSSAGATITGGLTVSSGGAAITGNSTVTGTLASTTTITAVDYVSVSGNASNAGSVRLYEDTDNGTNYTAIRGAASQSADNTVVLPSSWTDGQYLQCTVSGNTITLSTSNPATSASVPRYTLYGFQTSRDSGDTDHDIAITAGFCVGADNTTTISRATSIVKQIDAAWAEGSAAGGRASAISLTTNTWYHLFVISKNDGVTVDAGFDTSLTATNLLADATSYTTYRRIASVLTDASSNIISYHQRGDDFFWASTVTDYNSSSASTGNVTLSIPQDIPVLAKVNLYCNSDSAVGSNSADVYHKINVSGVSTNISVALSTNSGNPGAYLWRMYNAGEVLAELGNVGLVVSGTSPNVQIITSGWKDLRGKDGL